MRIRNHSGGDTVRLVRQVRQVGQIRLHLWCFALFAVFALTAPAEELKLDASVNRNSIYIGESVILTLTVSGTDAQGQPDLSAVTNAAIRFLGSQNNSQYRITVINGVMKREDFRGRVFIYEVTPSATGTFKAGPVALAVGDRVLSSGLPLVQVTGIEKQDRVAVTVKASRESVLVDEPFDVTMTLTLRQLPGRYAEYDPLDPSDPPTLTVPFLEQQPISGLTTPDLQKILNEHLVRRNDAPGFAVNNYTTRRDPMDFGSFFDFGSFMEPQKARFIFDRQSVSTNGAAHYQYSLTLRYTPREEGSHTFGPVTFKGNTVSGVDNAGRAVKQPVFAVGPACTVRIVPPPEQGRPDSFIGAIGTNMIVEASLDSQTCNVGDPLKLTLTVSGQISMANLRPPALNLQPALTKDFRIYEDSVQTLSRDGTKQFIYTVRPVTTGTLELPPIEVSYYDAGLRAYRTVRTPPLPVRANEAPELSLTNLAATVTNRLAETQRAREDAFVIAPVVMDPAGTEPQTLSLSGNQVILLAAGPVAWLIVLAGRAVAARLRCRAASRRRRYALSEACALLRKAARAAGENPAAAAAAIHAAVRKYLADRLDAAEGGITPSDVRNLLASRGIEPDLIAALCALFERNFNRAYSGAAATPFPVSEECAAIQSLLEQIDAFLKKNATPSGGLSSGIGKLSLFLCAFVPLLAPCGAGSLCASPLLADSSVERQFLWNEANARIGSAATPQDFAQAAQAYQKLIRAGVRNGIVYYNLGVALLKARQYDEAAKAFLRAERYAGTSDDINHNLLIALKGGDKNSQVSLPWYRVPLFWHYGIPFSTRQAVATWAFLFLWIALILRMGGLRRIAQPLLVLSLIVLVLFGSSAASSLHSESNDRRLETRRLVPPPDAAKA